MKDTYLKYVRHPETYKLLLTDEEYTRKVCFQEITSYSTAFLFFVETETTVGYGTRSITSNCPEAILLLIIQVRQFTLKMYNLKCKLKLWIIGTSVHVRTKQQNLLYKSLRLSEVMSPNENETLYKKSD